MDIMHLHMPCCYRKLELAKKHALDVGDCIQFIVWETDVDLQLLNNIPLTAVGGHGDAKGGAIDCSSHDQSRLFKLATCAVNVCFRTRAKLL